jgi:hypothetical protein
MTESELGMSKKGDSNSQAPCSPFFDSQYGCIPAGLAEACPACKRGKLREHALGKMCEGDVRHGVDRCGYKSWRPMPNKTLCVNKESE